jgi:hypothetical protein
MTNIIPPHLSATAITAVFLAGFIASPAAAQLRPLSTDRPDTTESPRTVDAGHFQFELELAAWERDGGARTLNLGELNLKAGLTPDTDLQLVLPLYSRSQGGGPEGFGDVTLRLKHNLFGNDEGDTALALMPFIKFSTANGDVGNGAWEGGLIVPFGFTLPGGWSAGVMTELDLAADESGSEYHLSWVNSATVNHGLTEHTAFFLELVSVVNSGHGHGSEAYFNAGLTWGVVSNWQLDGGLRTGLTADSVDLTPFLGVSAKF